MISKNIPKLGPIHVGDTIMNSSKDYIPLSNMKRCLNRNRCKYHIAIIEKI